MFEIQFKCTTISFQFTNRLSGEYEAVNVDSSPCPHDFVTSDALTITCTTIEQIGPIVDDIIDVRAESDYSLTHLKELLHCDYWL